MIKFLFYLMIVLAAIFAISFFFSIFTAGTIPIIDGVAAIVCAWNARSLKKRIRTQTTP
ncbi:hypothetical protein [Pontibacillus chungwhensis]|uniref:hypothetical protein n=1 Tax=Pontibacillus chungwhensis TaxID=265426 RepID=UPI0012EC5D0A|nr:hypothetical protein [Pontibacillus chungwhensis]